MSNFTFQYQESEIIRAMQHACSIGIKKSTGLERLPLEITLQIIEFLPVEAKYQASLVCKQWHTIVKPFLYYSPSLYTNSLKDFINCLSSSENRCLGTDHPNGYFIRQLELMEPNQQEKKRDICPISVEDVVYLLESTPNLTSLVVHNSAALPIQLFHRAIFTKEFRHPLRRVEFRRPLLDCERDLYMCVQNQLTSIVYYSFKIMDYYRFSLEQLYIPWDFYRFQALISLYGFPGYLSQYKHLKKLEIQIPPVNYDFNQYWTPASPGPNCPIDRYIYPCPSLIAIIESNEQHAFTELILGQMMLDQMSNKDHQLLFQPLDKNLYSNEYPSLEKLKIALGFFSASCIDYITRRFPRIPQLDITMVGRDDLQSAYDIRCIKKLIGQMSTNSYHCRSFQDTHPPNPSQTITFIERETDAGFGYHPTSIEPNYIDAYSHLIDFDQLCTKTSQISLTFLNGDFKSFPAVPPFSDPRFLFNTQFGNSRCSITFCHQRFWHGHLQHLSQFLKEKGHYFQLLNLKQDADVDTYPHQARISVIDVIRHCPCLETLYLKGYDEINLRALTYMDDQVVPKNFPSVTHVDIRSMKWENPSSCPRLMTRLFPQVQQLYLEYPLHSPATINTTCFFDFSAAHKLDMFGVDIPYFFLTRSRRITIQIELVATNQVVSYELDLCSDLSPVSITRFNTASNRRNTPAAVFTFYRFSSMLLTCFRRKKMLRMDPRFHDSYYFHTYTDSSIQDYPFMMT